MSIYQARYKNALKKAAQQRTQKVSESVTKHEPVAVIEITYGSEPECYVTGNIDDFPEGVFKLYAAPVRTKDLTDDEIDEICLEYGSIPNTKAIRAVIAADRERNK